MSHHRLEHGQKVFVFCIYHASALHSGIMWTQALRAAIMAIKPYIIIISSYITLPTMLNALLHGETLRSKTPILTIPACRRRHRAVNLGCFLLLLLWFAPPPFTSLFFFFFLATSLSLVSLSTVVVTHPSPVSGDGRKISSPPKKTHRSNLSTGTLISTSLSHTSPPPPPHPSPVLGCALPFVSCLFPPFPWLSMFPCFSFLFFFYIALQLDHI